MLNYIKHLLSSISNQYKTFNIEEDHQSNILAMFPFKWVVFEKIFKTFFIYCPTLKFNPSAAAISYFWSPQKTLNMQKPPYGHSCTVCCFCKKTTFCSFSNRLLCWTMSQYIGYHIFHLLQIQNLKFGKGTLDQQKTDDNVGYSFHIKL